MRVTNAQLAELEDIIEAKGLGLSLFERIRSENDGGFKYQQEYYQYVVRKNDGEYFISFVSWVGNRETVQYKESWARTKQYFESWINEIKTEIEAENKLNLRINSTKLKQFPQMILKFS